MEWYKQNMGEDAANKFFHSVYENVERLSHTPDIGRLESNYHRTGYTIRSLLIYKHYRIYYRYNEQEVVIVTLWDTRSIKR